jgi:hypothetical protein
MLYNIEFPAIPLYASSQERLRFLLADNVTPVTFVGSRNFTMRFGVGRASTVYNAALTLTQNEGELIPETTPQDGWLTFNFIYEKIKRLRPITYDFDLVRTVSGVERPLAIGRATFIAGVGG